MEHVLVFGATSAIAQELCALHAARGDRLHLVGRAPEKLEALRERLHCTATVADFNELEGLASLVHTSVAALGRVDRVFIAHGFLGEQLGTEADFTQAEHVLRSNLLSTVALLVPLANLLEAQQHGRLGVITSVAAERGRPRNYTYGAAKAALNTYLQGLRSRLYSAKVSVTTIKLGPVDTPMTHNHAKHRLFGQAKPVAEDILRAMDARAGEVYVPSYWQGIMAIVRATPEWLFQRVGFLSGR